MKKQLVLFLGLILLGCSKENNSNSALQNDRLLFSSFKEYHETYLLLSKFTSQDELTFWAQTKNHSTLLNTTDTSLLQYSAVFRTILNKDSEFEIGDSVVTFKNGDLLACAKKEYKKDFIESNPEKFTKVGEVHVAIVNHRDPKTVNLNVGTVNAYWQNTFTQHSYQPCGGTLTTGDGCRKFVSEILDESTISYPGPVFYSDLWLRIKLEWKNCSRGSWNPASEQRHVTCTAIYTTAYWYPGGFGGSYGPAYVDESCWSGDAYVHLMYAEGADPWYPSDVPFWNVTMTGTITQHVNGDTNSPITVPPSGNSLW